MLNTENFIKKLETILDYYGLNASSFADKIGVQRSSLSHLLSGRNKPSLDFILKILEVFPEVDLYWILDGKGTFPKSEIEPEKNVVTPPAPIIPNPITENKAEKVSDLFSEELVADSKNPIFEKSENNFSNMPISATPKNNSNIDRIVVFYTNGTFKTYAPE